MIRLFVITPTRLYAEALAGWFKGVATIEVVGMATCSHEAQKAIAMIQPDVVLLDAMMVPVPALMIGLLSAVESGLKLIAFAIPDNPDQVVAWVEAGACGYVTSDTPLRQLIPIIESVARGELLCPTSVASALLRRIQRLAASTPRPPEVQLTARQCEVIEQVARGLSNKEIARAMGISLATVKNHMHNIFEKLQVHRRADALSRLGRNYIAETTPRKYSA
jgi:two-component system, NarL family, nitrate/nitrite response regulator NarL